ncbi:hypothetical protein ACFV0L_18965 [Streptosporangium canum]|uniref:hypothetical protein n=1 Tax=Streptosporangium canum TaxID=324952 RepID=UPI0036AC9C60
MRLMLDQIPTSVTEEDAAEPPATITDEIAEQVRNAIAENFDADPDYAPQVMDADWDAEGGRVIVWENFPDWAYLVRHGGAPGFGDTREYPPVPLPAGVWVEVVNPMAIRVLPNR